MTPDLSVVFPVHHRLDLLERTLAAWRNQRGGLDIELIVADDSDCASAAAAQYGAVYIPVLKYVYRKGPVTSWNEGLRAATGRVLACTHPEIIPDNDVARYFVGVCEGRPELCADLGPVWDGIDSPPMDIRALGSHAVRATLPVYRLQESAPIDAMDWRTNVKALEGLPGFWSFELPDFEADGHTNDAIRRYPRFFWNNLFAMRRELWEWMNFHRPTEEWGMDDTDFQERNQYLRILFVYGRNQPCGYHQHHQGTCRGGLHGFHQWTDEECARLVWLYPGTAGRPCPLSREMPPTL